MLRLNPTCLSKPHSKLQLKSSSPFKILERIGINAYVIDLPPEWTISNTFNTSDLIEFHGSPSIPSKMFESSPILVRDTTPILFNIASKIGKEQVDYICG